MNTQLDPTESIEIKEENTRPDRLASAALIIGFILVSLFGSFGSISLLAAGRFPPFMLLMSIVGVSGIIYGRSRMSRGSSTTKQLYENTRQKIWSGALAGIAATFLAYLVNQSEGLNLSWVVSFLILSIVWALLFGIPSGGIGGLVLASIWKNKYAAFIGGAIAGASFSSFWMLRYFGG